MTPDFDDADEPVAAALLAEVDRLAGATCRDCGRSLCDHLLLFNVVLGLQDAPRCLACLAAGLARDPQELRDQLGEHVQRRACYRQAWQRASRREGLIPDRYPSCLWSSPPDQQTRTMPPPPPAEGVSPAGPPAAAWDAGDMGCGELVLALRGRLNALRPGDVLEVTARDPAAPEDLPAWCRLTGHRLVGAAHPHYRIQRKEP